jgi:predicted dienelactone hydrolase
MIQVWYPAQAATGMTTAPYLPTPVLLEAMKKEQYLDVPAEALEAWSSMRTHAYLDAPLAALPRRLPLLLFSPGFGVSRVNYTALMQDFASHGYVVAAVDHPYCGLSVLPGGRVLSSSNPEGKSTPEARVEAMAMDAAFVRDKLLDVGSTAGRFARRLDPNRVGIFGHSIGGAAALEAGRTDSPFRACADLDGDAWGKVETEGVKRPFLVLLNVPGPPIHIPEAMRKQRDAQWTEVMSRRKTPAYIVKIRNTTHFSFSDLPFLVSAALMQKNGGTLAPTRGHQIIATLLRTFFSEYLGGRKRGALEQVVREYPEVTLEDFGLMHASAATR